MPALTFEPDGHVYKLDNQIVPGVTSILQDAGLVDTTWFTEESRVRGQAVHTACHFLDENDLDWDTVDPAIEGYIRGYERFKREAGFEPQMIEARVYSSMYRYAGTLDRVGTVNGRLAVLDLKTGAPGPWAALQLRAYQQAVQEMGTDLCIFDRYGLQLKPDGTYKLHPYKDRNDWQVFCSALAIVNWKHNTGGRNGSNHAR